MWFWAAHSAGGVASFTLGADQRWKSLSLYCFFSVLYPLEGILKAEVDWCLAFLWFWAVHSAGGVSPFPLGAVQRREVSLFGCFASLLSSPLSLWHPLEDILKIEVDWCLAFLWFWAVHSAGGVSPFPLGAVQRREVSLFGSFAPLLSSPLSLWHPLEDILKTEVDWCLAFLWFWAVHSAGGVSPFPLGAVQRREVSLFGSFASLLSSPLTLWHPLEGILKAEVDWCLAFLWFWAVHSAGGVSPFPLGAVKRREVSLFGCFASLLSSPLSLWHPLEDILKIEVDWCLAFLWFWAVHSAGGVSPFPLGAVQRREVSLFGSFASLLSSPFSLWHPLEDILKTEVDWCLAFLWFWAVHSAGGVSPFPLGAVQRREVSLFGSFVSLLSSPLTLWHPLEDILKAEVDWCLAFLWFWAVHSAGGVSPFPLGAVKRREVSLFGSFASLLSSPLSLWHPLEDILKTEVDWCLAFLWFWAVHSAGGVSPFPLGAVQRRLLFGYFESIFGCFASLLSSPLTLRHPLEDILKAEVDWCLAFLWFWAVHSVGGVSPFPLGAVQRREVSLFGCFASLLSSPLTLWHPLEDILKAEVDWCLAFLWFWAVHSVGGVSPFPLGAVQRREVSLFGCFASLLSSPLTLWHPLEDILKAEVDWCLAFLWFWAVHSAGGVSPFPLGAVQRREVSLFGSFASLLSSPFSLWHPLEDILKTEVDWCLAFLWFWAVHSAGGVSPFPLGAVQRREVSLFGSFVSLLSSPLTLWHPLEDILKAEVDWCLAFLWFWAVHSAGGVSPFPLGAVKRREVSLFGSFASLLSSPLSLWHPLEDILKTEVDWCLAFLWFWAVHSAGGVSPFPLGAVQRRLLFGYFESIFGCFASLLSSPLTLRHPLEDILKAEVDWCLAFLWFWAVHSVGGVSPFPLGAVQRREVSLFGCFASLLSSPLTLWHPLEDILKAEVDWCLAFLWFWAVHSVGGVSPFPLGAVQRREVSLFGCFASLLSSPLTLWHPLEDILKAEVDWCLAFLWFWAVHSAGGVSPFPLGAVQRREVSLFGSFASLLSSPLSLWHPLEDILKIEVDWCLAFLWFWAVHSAGGVSPFPLGAVQRREVSLFGSFASLLSSPFSLWHPLEGILKAEVDWCLAFLWFWAVHSAGGVSPFPLGAVQRREVSLFGSFVSLLSSPLTLWHPLEDILKTEVDWCLAFLWFWAVHSAGGVSPFPLGAVKRREVSLFGSFASLLSSPLSLWHPLEDILKAEVDWCLAFLWFWAVHSAGGVSPFPLGAVQRRLLFGYFESTGGFPEEKG